MKFIVIKPTYWPGWTVCTNDRVASIKTKIPTRKEAREIARKLNDALLSCLPDCLTHGFCLNCVRAPQHKIDLYRGEKK